MATPTTAEKTCPHCGKVGHVRTNHRDCDLNPDKGSQKPDEERCSFYAQGETFINALKPKDVMFGLQYKGIMFYREITKDEFDSVGSLAFTLLDDNPELLAMLKKEESNLEFQAAENKLEQARADLEALKLKRSGGGS